MIIELSLMVLSGAVIVSLYVHRYFEVKHGVITKVHAVRTKTDPLIESVQAKTNVALSHVTWHHVSIFFYNLFVHSTRFFMHLSRRIHDSLAQVSEKATRRKEDLSKARSASFYLKQIKDAKDSGAMSETGGEKENM